MTMGRARSLMQAMMLLSLHLLCGGAHAQHESWEGRCVGVADGDTINVLHRGKAERIRLYGIDCPERDQDFGTKARQFTASLVMGKAVSITPVDTDIHGRTVAWVTVDGTSLNHELVKKGLAWWYRRHAQDRQDLQDLEKQARLEKIGLWSHPKPIPPWKFRKGPSSTFR